MLIPTTTDLEFEQDVLSAEHPVLVIFSAEWCGPCHQMTAVLQDLAEEIVDRVHFVKVDVDENPDHAARLGVRGMPSLFLFHGGVKIGHRSGAAKKAIARRWIEETLGSLSTVPC